MNPYGISEDAYKLILIESEWLAKLRAQHGFDYKDTLPMVYAEQGGGEIPLLIALGLYVRFIDSGITPPARVLAIVAKGFRCYLDSAGEKTLDESFELISKQGVGHPLKHNAKKEIERCAQILVFEIRKEKEEANKKRPSIVKAAEDVIQKFNLTCEAESLARSYSTDDTENTLGGVFKCDPDFATLIIKYAKDTLLDYGIKNGF
jgi:hypothetical protein